VSDSATLEPTDERWAVVGALTMDTVAALLAASTDMALPASGSIDLSRVELVDSASVALLLAWKRRAKTEHKTISFTSVPASLASLAELYAVEELLVT
jgi:ABC-type transporter Mla MlaB component